MEVGRKRNKKINFDPTSRRLSEENPLRISRIHFGCFYIEFALQGPQISPAAVFRRELQRANLRLPAS